MTLDERDLFPAPDGPHPGAAPARKCRRHSWSFDVCTRCFTVRDLTASRRGRTNRRAGNDAERAIAKAYGGRRTGQAGGPDDVIVDGLFVIQSKAGRSWYRQSYVDELDKLPRSEGRVPTLVISDRPGPGHRTRRYVVRLIEDDVDLHGKGDAK